MITFAGSKGGPYGMLTQADRHMMNRVLKGKASPQELERMLQERSRPSIGLVANNACNLKCKHCYLQVKKLFDVPLTQTEWHRFAASAAENNVALLSVCGKEPLLGPDGMKLLRVLTNLRAEFKHSFRVGLISNGTLMARHRDTLEQLQPDFVDVSVEGLHGINDQVRGEGSFLQALGNIEWAAETFEKRFFLAMTIQKLNYQHAEEVADYFRRRRIRNFFLTFYQPQPYSDRSLALEESKKLEMLEGLHWVSRLPPGSPFTLYVDLDFLSSNLLPMFLQSHWFDLENLEVDETGIYFLRFKWDNNASLVFRFPLFPQAFWHTARVTPEGFYLASEDTLDTTQYERLAVANIREFDCNFLPLQKYALASTRYRDIMDHYWQVQWPEVVCAMRKQRMYRVA